MEAVIRIIRYLKETPNHGVLFKSNGHLEIQAYTNADSASDDGNRRSSSSYFTLVGRNLVTWKRKKQKVVALSSVEAEFRGIARGLAEILWIKKLLTELGFPSKGTSRMMCDNEAGIQISENPVQHEFNMIEQNTWRLSDTSLKKNWKMELLNFRSSDQKTRRLTF